MATDAKRPDEAAMWRILERNPHDPEGVILRLAWLQGLGRGEMNELTWDQIDFEEKKILLPDRTVPMEASTLACLQKRFELYGGRSDRVIIADRGKKPMTLVNLSRLAKLALDSEGQEVTLKDLRRDWILRQIESHGWAYAVKVSGMTLSSLRATFGPEVRKHAETKKNEELKTGEEQQSTVPDDETEYTLWRIVQQEGSSAAGLAIWMCWKLGMQPGEVASLTWEQVDFETGRIRLSDREIDMGTRMRRLLGEAWERQKALTVPNVFVAPTTGSPMDQSRISVVARTAMIRGGLENFSLRVLCAWVHARQVDDALLRRAEEQGFLGRADVVRLFNVSEWTAWSYLDRLADSGRLVKIGARYYPAGSVVAPEEQLEKLRGYLAEHGSGRRQDFVQLLHIAPHQVTHTLQGMVSRKELIREGKYYRLPSEDESKENAI